MADEPENLLTGLKEVESSDVHDYLDISSKVFSSRALKEEITGHISDSLKFTIMKPPFPAPITNWHNDTYPAITPTRPEVLALGKTIIITGGGTGIGRATVEAFAQAKAATIAITGRRIAPLEETKRYIEGKYDANVLIFAADVTDAAAMKKVAAEVGSWDVLVNNAGYYATAKTISESDIDDWWKGWEVRICANGIIRVVFADTLYTQINVKGTFVVWQAFHGTAKKDAVFIGTATAAVTLPLQMSIGQSSYIASKQGLIKVLEILAAEESNISVRVFHPGVIETDLAAKAGAAGVLPVDKGEHLFALSK